MQETLDERKKRMFFMREIFYKKKIKKQKKTEDFTENKNEKQTKGLFVRKKCLD